MKITRIDVMHVRCDSRGYWRPVAVRVHTDEGVFGDGEAGICSTCLPYAIFGMLREIAPMIIGMDALSTEVIWEKLYKTTFWGQTNAPVLFAAMSGIDMALWDIKGKALNLPVYKLLGGAFRDKFPSYGSQIQHGWGKDIVPCKSPEDYAAAAKAVTAEGMFGVKVNPFTYDEEGKSIPNMEHTGFLNPHDKAMVEDRVAAIREAIGPERELMLELHGLTDVNASLSLIGALEKYRPLFVEEPVKPDAAAFRQIKKGTQIPIATGERLTSRWVAAPFLEEGLIQLIQPDLTVCGGFTEAKKICDLAHAHDVNVQAHCCGTPLSHMAALHLEAAIPNFAFHENIVFHHSNWNKKCCTKAPIVDRNGAFSLPEGPGIGTEWSDFVLNCEEKYSIDYSMN